MEWSAVLALLSLAGFATQRVLELLDPAFVFLAKRLVTLAKKPAGEIEEKMVKAWLMNFAALGMAIGVVVSHPELTLPGVDKPLARMVIALAISVGSNAANSLVKFGEYAKEAKKQELRPAPNRL
jgi:ABC-type iron transport system FetAB permease component